MFIVLFDSIRRELDSRNEIWSSKEALSAKEISICDTASPQRCDTFYRCSSCGKAFTMRSICAFCAL